MAFELDFITSYCAAPETGMEAIAVIGTALQSLAETPDPAVHTDQVRVLAKLLTQLCDREGRHLKLAS